MSLLTILIIEDNSRHGDALTKHLASAEDMQVVGLAVDCATARQKFVEYTPNVAIVDLDLPDGHGEDLITEFVQRPECTVLVYSQLNDTRRILGALRRGAAGYIYKDDSSFSIQDAIRSITEGHAPMSPQIASSVLAYVKSTLPVPSAEEYSLSEREMQIIKLISKGYTSAEVAEILNLKYNTVSSYIKKLYRKLDVNSRSEAIYEARLHGLLDDSIEDR